MNLNVVRGRAGVVHASVWIILLNTLLNTGISLKPLVFYQLYDFFVASTFGITPLSISGCIGWLLTKKEKPKWKQVQPL